MLTSAPAARTPRTATHDPVVLAAESMLASLVELLEMRGAFAASAYLVELAGNDAYVACVAREARLDAIHGGRAARVEHLAASLKGP